MRIVSLLPSATELIVLAGGGPDMVGRSHECDWPSNVVDALPKLTASKIHANTSLEIDEEVRKVLSESKDLYTVDAAKLRELRPDVIVTQSLCEVCSVSINAVECIANKMDPRPAVIDTNPMAFDQVMEDLLKVGRAIGREVESKAAHASLLARVSAIEGRVAAWRARRAAEGKSSEVRVAMLEWVEPLFFGGHWTPEVIAMAGGTHPLNPSGGRGQGALPSVARPSQELMDADVDVIIIAPCGLDLPRTRRELAVMKDTSWFEDYQRRGVPSENLEEVPGDKVECPIRVPLVVFYAHVQIVYNTFHAS